MFPSVDLFLAIVTSILNEFLSSYPTSDLLYLTASGFLSGLSGDMIFNSPKLGDFISSLINSLIKLSRPLFSSVFVSFPFSLVSRLFSSTSEIVEVRYDG